MNSIPLAREFIVEHRHQLEKLEEIIKIAHEFESFLIGVEVKVDGEVFSCGNVRRATRAALAERRWQIKTMRKYLHTAYSNVANTLTGHRSRSGMNILFKYRLECEYPGFSKIVFWRV